MNPEQAPGNLIDPPAGEEDKVQGRFVFFGWAGSLGIFLLLTLYIAPSVEAMINDICMALPSTIENAFAISRFTRSPLGLAALAALGIGGCLLYFLKRRKGEAAHLFLGLLIAQSFLAVFTFVNLL